MGAPLDPLKSFVAESPSRIGRRGIAVESVTDLIVRQDLAFHRSNDSFSVRLF